MQNTIVEFKETLLDEIKDTMQTITQITEGRRQYYKDLKLLLKVLDRLCGLEHALIGNTATEYAANVVKANGR